MKKKLLFEVNELECTRDFSSLFNPISFKLFSGDLFVIKGSNGSGKTSFLHCLAGLVPFKGGITWHIENSAIGYVGHKIAVKDHDTVKDFLKTAFGLLNLDWEDYVLTSERYLRPNEVDHLLGDYSKAKKDLNWEPSTSFEELVKMMIESDIELAKREEVLLKENLIKPTWEYPLK